MFRTGTSSTYVLVTIGGSTCVLLLRCVTMLLVHRLVAYPIATIREYTTTASGALTQMEIILATILLIGFTYTAIFQDEWF